MNEWSERVAAAIAGVGTPCYITAWRPIAAAAERLDALEAAVPVRSWLSFKTHPLAALASQWIGSGRGVEVVSERELATVIDLGCPVDQLLVNGVAKHTWLSRFEIPRLQVHFDSLRELRALLPAALQWGWRTGVRVHAPDECDARDPRYGGQFGLDVTEAVDALGELQAAGADIQSVHFHLGQRAHDPAAYLRAVERLAEVCDQAGVSPTVVDCGGALPAAHDPACAAALEGLAAALSNATARFPRLREIWLENGRFISEASSALVVTVVDIKERPEGRYLICDGGRTNHALAADAHTHPIWLSPPREATMRATTVCGPTCMTDDRLGRWPLPESVDVGDVVVWMNAGAYHLPWENRFSHGLCAIAWFDEAERMTVARARERSQAWAHQ